MSMYNDVYAVSYKKLMQKVTDNKQYKGGQGKAKLLQYPVGARKYSQRLYVLDDKVFRIYMVHRQAYLDNPDNKRVQDCEVARVHPDNSFEFLNCNWMSHQQFSYALSGFGVKQSSKHGGPVMYTQGHILHPIYRGLRIDLTTGEAVTPYTVKYRKLIRKEAAATLTQFDEFKQMWPIMLGALTPAGIGILAKDIYPRNGAGELECVSGAAMGRVREYIDAGNYADAALMFAMHNGNITRWMTDKIDKTRPDYASWFGDYFINRLKATVVRDFDDAILREYPHVFKLVDRKEGEALKACKWGYVVESVQTDLFGGHKIVR